MKLRKETLKGKARAAEARKVLSEAKQILGLNHPYRSCSILGEHCAVFIHRIKHHSEECSESVRKDRNRHFRGTYGHHLMIEVEPLEVGIRDVDWSKLRFYLTDGYGSDTVQYHEVRFTQIGVAIALHLTSDLGYQAKLRLPRSDAGRKVEVVEFIRWEEHWPWD